MFHSVAWGRWQAIPVNVRWLALFVALAVVFAVLALLVAPDGPPGAVASRWAWTPPAAWG